MNKKIVLLVSALVFLSSTALALRVPMWRKVFEQDDIKYYINQGSLKQFSESWNFGYLEEGKFHKLTATQLCKKSENGVWSRFKNAVYCDEYSCNKPINTDWKELSYNTVGYEICKVSLPYCDEPSKGKKGMCQVRPEKDEEAADEEG